jgi:hypothetical protein
MQGETAKTLKSFCMESRDSIKRARAAKPFQSSIFILSAKIMQTLN